MKKLLKRIWYRIRYKIVRQPNGDCAGCVNENKKNGCCADFWEIYGSDCRSKIFVKRFKLSL